jgi:hypothetical protein
MKQVSYKVLVWIVSADRNRLLSDVVNSITDRRACIEKLLMECWDDEDWELYLACQKNTYIQAYCLENTKNPDIIESLLENDVGNILTTTLPISKIKSLMKLWKKHVDLSLVHKELPAY